MDRHNRYGLSRRNDVGRGISSHSSRNNQLQSRSLVQHGAKRLDLESSGSFLKTMFADKDINIDDFGDMDDDDGIFEPQAIRKLNIDPPSRFGEDWEPHSANNSGHNYSKHLGNIKNQPDKQRDTPNDGQPSRSPEDAALRQSTVIGSLSSKNAKYSLGSKPTSTIPDGLGTRTYPPPQFDLMSLKFDPTVGLRFDEVSGLHYDANMGYFYNNDLGIYLYWDDAKQTYFTKHGLRPRKPPANFSIFPNPLNTSVSKIDSDRQVLSSQQRYSPDYQSSDSRSPSPTNMGRARLETCRKIQGSGELPYRSRSGSRISNISRSGQSNTQYTRENVQHRGYAGRRPRSPEYRCRSGVQSRSTSHSPNRSRSRDNYWRRNISPNRTGSNRRTGRSPRRSLENSIADGSRSTSRTRIGPIRRTGKSQMRGRRSRENSLERRNNDRSRSTSRSQIGSNRPTDRSWRSRRSISRDDSERRRSFEKSRARSRSRNRIYSNWRTGRSPMGRRSRENTLRRRTPNNRMTDVQSGSTSSTGAHQYGVNTPAEGSQIWSSSRDDSGRNFEKSQVDNPRTPISVVEEEISHILNDDQFEDNDLTPNSTKDGNVAPQFSTLEKLDDQETHNQLESHCKSQNQSIISNVDDIEHNEHDNQSASQPEIVREKLKESVRDRLGPPSKLCISGKKWNQSTNGAICLEGLYLTSPTNCVLLQLESCATGRSLTGLEAIKESVTSRLRYKNINFHKVIASSMEECGAPYDHLHVIFQSPNDAISWSTRQNGSIIITSPQYVGTTETFKLTLHYSSGNWKCVNCHKRNFTLRSLCFYCLSSRSGDPTFFNLVSHPTKFVGINGLSPMTVDRTICDVLVHLNCNPAKLCHIIRDPVIKLSSGICICEMDSVQQGIELFESFSQLETLTIDGCAISISYLEVDCKSEYFQNF